MMLSRCTNIKQQQEWERTFKTASNVSTINTREEPESKFKNHFQGYQLGDIYPLQIKTGEDDEKKTTHFMLVEVQDYTVIKTDVGTMLDPPIVRTKTFMDILDLRIIRKYPVVLKKRTATWILYGTMNNEGGFTEMKRRKIMNCRLRFISDVYIGNQTQQLVVAQSTCPTVNEQLYHHVVYTLKAGKDTISTVNFQYIQIYHVLLTNTIYKL